MSDTYTKNDWSDILPAAMKAKLDLQETGIKYVNDERDKESAPGRALVEAPTVAAQREALNVDSKAEVTAKAQLPANVAAAIEAGTATATPADTDVETSVSAAHVLQKTTWAQKKAALATAFKHGGSNEIATATPGANVIPKAGADSKLAAGFIPQATSAAIGGALLGASGGATKLTKMPDGDASPVYAKEFLNTFDSWQGISNCTPSAAATEMILTWSNTFGTATKLLPSTAAGKTVLVLARCGIVGAVVSLVYRSDTLGYVNIGSVTVKTANVYFIISGIVPIDADAYKRIGIGVTGVANGVTTGIKWCWIGDYSYLTGSLSEEAARVWSEAADAPGVPQAASGTLTFSSNAINGDTVTAGGKTYTFRDATYWDAGLLVEGDIKLGATAAGSADNLHYGICRKYPGSYDGLLYKCAAPNPIVFARPSSNIVQITAGVSSGVNNEIGTPTVGENGNLITLAESTSGARIVKSGLTLVGGYSAGAAKMSYLVARASQNLDAKTSLVAGDYLTLLDSVVGFLKKKILVSNFFAADGGTGAYTAVQGNDGRLTSSPATWTPAPYLGVDADDGTYTISENYYTKNGKFCHAEFRITWTAKGTKTGALSFIYTPLASRSTQYMPVGQAVVFAGGVSITATPLVVISGSRIYVHLQGAAATTAITNSNLSNTTDLKIVIDYIAA
mgnify:CR=1 FL=1